jgi:VWFA-related protein
LFATPLLGLALAIQAPDEVRFSSHAYVPAIRVDTRLVEIAAVVRDGHGKPVAGLTKDDFRVLEDGRERLIDHFVVQNTLPDALNDLKSAVAPALKSGSPAATPAPSERYLALFFDDVNATDAELANGLKSTQAAAKKFVKDALKGDVRIGIFTESGLQTVEFTTDEAKLIDAISALKAHTKMREEGLTHCPRITPYLAYRIAAEKDQGAVRAVMFDAGQKGCGTPPAVIVTQAEETWRQVQALSTDTLNAIGRVVVHLGTMPGKRELLLASSGFLAMAQQELKDKIINRALQAGVVINALDAKGIYNEAQPGVRPQDGGLTETGTQAGNNAWIKFETTEMPLRLQVLSEPLGTLAEGTGGVFYHNNNDLAAGFRKLGNPPEVTYRLGFRPEGAADGGYHKLKVTAKKYAVQARPGYFAPRADSLQSVIDREILAEDTVADFPIGIQLQQDQGTVSVMVSIDISKLRFSKEGDRQVQKVAFTAALFDAQGKMAAAKEGTMDLSLTEATFKRLVSTGVNANVTFAVPAGKYKLRQVTEEALDGKIACSSRAVEIH